MAYTHVVWVGPNPNDRFSNASPGSLYICDDKVVEGWRYCNGIDGDSENIDPM